MLDIGRLGLLVLLSCAILLSSGAAAENKTMRMMLLSEPVEGSDFAIVVLDMLGNPMSGASVAYGGQATLTGDDGKAIFAGLPGRANVTVEKEGYDTLEDTLTSKPPSLVLQATASAAPKAVQDQNVTYLLIGAIALLILVILYMAVIRPRRL
jgi:hypothetical protein